MDDGIMETQPMDFNDETMSDTENRNKVGYLKFIDTSLSKTEFDIYEGINLIGREESCNIQLNSKSVSKKHAIIEANDNAIYIYDLGSRNKTRKQKSVFKTYVKYPLSHGEEITFGDVKAIFLSTESKVDDTDDCDETDSLTNSECVSEADSESILPVIEDSILNDDNSHGNQPNEASSLEEDFMVLQQINAIPTNTLLHNDEKNTLLHDDEKKNERNTPVQLNEKSKEEPSPVIIEATPNYVPKKRVYRLEQPTTINESIDNEDRQQEAHEHQQVKMAEINFESQDKILSEDKLSMSLENSPDIEATLVVEPEVSKADTLNKWNSVYESVDSEKVLTDIERMEAKDMSESTMDPYKNMNLDLMETQKFDVIVNDENIESNEDTTENEDAGNKVKFDMADMATQRFASHADVNDIDEAETQNFNIDEPTGADDLATQCYNNPPEAADLATQYYNNAPVEYDDLATQKYDVMSYSEQISTQVYVQGDSRADNNKSITPNKSCIFDVSDELSTQPYALTSPEKPIYKPCSSSSLPGGSGVVLTTPSLTQPVEEKRNEMEECSEIPYNNSNHDDDMEATQAYNVDLNKSESQYYFDETIPDSDDEEVDEINKTPSKNDHLNQSVLKDVFKTTPSPSSMSTLNYNVKKTNEATVNIPVEQKDRKDDTSNNITNEVYESPIQPNDHVTTNITPIENESEDHTSKRLPRRKRRGGERVTVSKRKSQRNKKSNTDIDDSTTNDAPLLNVDNDKNIDLPPPHSEDIDLPPPHSEGNKKVDTKETPPDIEDIIDTNLPHDIDRENSIPIEKNEKNTSDKTSEIDNSKKINHESDKEDEKELNKHEIACSKLGGEKIINITQENHSSSNQSHKSEKDMIITKYIEVKNNIEKDNSFVVKKRKGRNSRTRKASNKSKKLQNVGDNETVFESTVVSSTKQSLPEVSENHQKFVNKESASTNQQPENHEKARTSSRRNAKLTKNINSSKKDDDVPSPPRSSTSTSSLKSKSTNRRIPSINNTIEQLSDLDDKKDITTPKNKKIPLKTSTKTSSRSSKRKLENNSVDDTVNISLNNESNDTLLNETSNIHKSRRKSLQEKPKVIFTGISHKAMEKTIKDLGGDVVDDISKATVLVTDKVRRTVKFLCALSKGITIVGPSWLAAIKNRKVFPNPQDYLLVDKAAEKLYEFSLDRSLRCSKETPLLNNIEVFVTPKVQPDPKAMKEIVSSAGGKFLTKTPTKSKENLIVISCEDDRSTFMKFIEQDIHVCTAEVILKGILQQTLDINAHLIITEGKSRKRKSSSEKESESGSRSKTKSARLDNASSSRRTRQTK